MRNLTAVVFLMGGALLASQSASGQITYNDLYFGFQNQAGGGTADYIINLGPATNIVGGSTVVDLSGDFSLSDFNAVLGASSSMFGGVVGALQGNQTADVYLTQLRGGGAGTPSVAGSTAPAGLSRSFDNGAAVALSTLFSPAAGVGGLDPNKTWESDVEPTFTANSFWGNTGVNPDSSVGHSSVLYEDLWFTSNSSISGTQPFVYEGYFTLDLTGANPKLTFTPKNAPVSLTPPVIVSVNKTGSTVTVVSSNAVPTYNYQLQYTTSLNPTNWISVGSAVVAGGAMVTNADATATGTQRFYRVQGH
ncbi:MAG: hypothetical protein ACLPRE_15490 [Limisphaerales bacterium]